ncbi:MAG: hypothetical protein AVDCRST_MAG34-2812, partial [uncultured Nocardioidaceae bacterium]
ARRAPVLWATGDSNESSGHGDRPHLGAHKSPHCLQDTL